MDRRGRLRSRAAGPRRHLRQVRRRCRAEGTLTGAGSACTGRKSQSALRYRTHHGNRGDREAGGLSELASGGQVRQHECNTVVDNNAYPNLMARENPGLHVASLAGTWMAAVHGFAGLRDRGGELRFRLWVRREQLEVEIRPEHAEYPLLSGEGLEAWHEEERLHLAPGEAVGAAIGRTV